MANFPVMFSAPHMLQVGEIPTVRGPLIPRHGFISARQRLDSDSVGSCNVRVVNAVTGSRYRLEIVTTGALVAEGAVTGDDFTVSVPYYPQGNANNAIKVKIRKATAAPKYQPFETQVEAVASGALAYIAQVPDPIA